MGELGIINRVFWNWAVCVFGRSLLCYFGAFFPSFIFGWNKFLGSTQLQEEEQEKGEKVNYTCPSGFVRVRLGWN